ncbi:MAG: IMS domain-containing protein [Cyanobacteria bacterium P01_E01_bin.42]
MRIPLDYYRILGVSIQATASQLGQAYHDRALQLPRREYSDIAINSRKQLLDEAYSILSDAEGRSEYDASFLAKTQPLNTQPLPQDLAWESDRNAPTAWLEINNEQFIGALSILQELGEYELVISLASPLLDRDSLTPEQERLISSELVRADIVLTIALACLELGREQWQQGQSEGAAASGKVGQELLLREGLFPNIRGEIQADIYKLRPYRVLELLSHDASAVSDRLKGVQLLQEMLQERGGIDGNGDDRSGLSVDDFLRFIQQIRGYLTAAEQQEIFELEARRPSAVATYLAVYALVGRGFAQFQPYLITRAKEMLQVLGRRQDVYLEQAVCALLLGQTEEASRALELSQEYEPLAFIREHSQGSPDLLPGLCLYGERWLQTEVFPHFRDLSELQASLKNYFADEQVQSYLEQLPSETDEPNRWSVVDPAPTSVSPSGQRTVGAVAAERTLQETPSGRTGTATLTPPQRTERVPTPAGRSPSRSRSAPRGEARNTPPTAQRQPAPQPPRRRREQPEEGETGSPPVARRSNRRRRSASRGESGSAGGRSSLMRFLILGAGGIVAILILWLAIGQGLKALFGETDEVPGSEANQPAISVDALMSAIARATEEVAPNAALGDLTEESARRVVETWLSVKKAALGEDHQIALLDSILADPTLGTWRDTAQSLQQENAYREYEHEVRVENVDFNPDNPNEARVDVAVREIAQAFRGGQPDASQSYDDNFRVRYELVRQDDLWRIRRATVL